MTKQTVKGIALIVLILIGMLIIGKVFKGSGASDVDKELTMSKEVIKAKDETIKAIQGERDAYELVSIEKDKSLAAHEKNDSMYLQTIKNNQPKYTANEKKSTDITKHVNDLDHDALLREIADY